MKHAPPIEQRTGPYTLLSHPLFEATAWATPAYALFFLMLFVPTVYQPVKAGLLCIVLATIGGKVLRREGRLPVHPAIIRWVWFFTTVGVFFVLLGVTRGNPGALRVSTVFVLWLWLYLFFIAGASSQAVLEGLLKVLVVAMLAITVYSLHYILYEVGIWPAGLYLELDLGQAIGFYSGFVEFNLYSISSLIYMVPFATAALLVWPETKAAGEAFPVPRRWLWAALLLGMIVVFLSGRRALLLCVALAPLFTFLFRSQLPAHQKVSMRKTIVRSVLGLAAVTVAVFWYLQQAYDISLEAIHLMFLEGFDFARGGDAGLRAEQFWVLLDEWLDRPFFGHGLGAAASLIRSDEQPWAYELQYIALLFHTGLVGTLCYAAGVAWIYAQSIRIMRAGQRLGLYVLPVLVGTTCFLLASATNPYLGKYDYLWVLFLPIALINLHLRAQRPPAATRTPS